MNSFLRIFRYVWPQWPRLVVVFITAAIIGLLFAISFVTVIPLLKVMMGEEGLHGWVDRKVCGWRYGMDFYVPETTDFTQTTGTDMAYHVRVTSLKEDSIAESGGLKPGDRITWVGKKDPLGGSDSSAKMPRSEILETLATVPPAHVLEVKLLRISGDNSLLELKLDLDTGRKTFIMDTAQNLVGILPREEGLGSTNKERAVAMIIVAMVIITAVRCIASFYQQYLAEKVIHVAIARLREDIFAHTLELPVGFFASRGSSDTVSRIVRDILVAGNGAKVLLGKGLREPLKAMSTLAFAMVISFKLTLIFIGCAPAIIGLGVLLGRKIKKHTGRSLVSSSRMLGKLSGAMAAIRVVKVYNRQDHEHQAYKNINRTFLKQVLHVAKIDSSTGPIMEMLGMVAGSAALLVGVHMVANANMMSSSFFTFLILLGTTAESIRKSSDIWNKIQQSNAAAERVFGVLDEPIEADFSDAIELPRLKEKVEFKDIVFTYPGSEKPVLKGVNLTVKAGHNVAVVGPNGSGKTTLVNLLPRFYNADSGTILIDGHDTHQCTLRSLRNQIGMVTQEVVTFNDTIAANIAYGKPGASMDDIIAAAKRSFAHEFIEPLPKGYQTVIGEQGAGLSGGQLQRIVIARAILKDPEILIFDEATSQVDADSEAKIHQAIQEIMKDRTSFIIAHRFSTIMNADVIVVMDKGRIVALGTHEELVRTCPLYQSLYETQLVAS